MNRDSQENALYGNCNRDLKKKDYLFVDPLAQKKHRRNILNFGGITKEASQSVGIEFKHFQQNFTSLKCWIKKLIQPRNWRWTMFFFSNLYRDKLDHTYISTIWTTPRN